MLCGSPAPVPQGKKVSGLVSGYWTFVTTGMCNEAVEVSLVMETTTPHQQTGCRPVWFKFSELYTILLSHYGMVSERGCGQFLRLDCMLLIECVQHYRRPDFRTWAPIFSFMQNQRDQSFPSHTVRSPRKLQKKYCIAINILNGTCAALSIGCVGTDAVGTGLLVSDVGAVVGMVVDGIMRRHWPSGYFGDICLMPVFCESNQACGCLCAGFS